MCNRGYKLSDRLCQNSSDGVDGFSSDGQNTHFCIVLLSHLSVLYDTREDVGYAA